MLAVNFMARKAYAPYNSSRGDEYHERSAICGSYFDTLKRGREAR